MVMFGWAAWNDATTFCQTPLSGWELPLFHQVRVALAVLFAAPALLLLLLLLVLPLLPLLHAAIVSAWRTRIEVHAQRWDDASFDPDHAWLRAEQYMRARRAHFTAAAHG